MLMLKTGLFLPVLGRWLVGAFSPGMSNLAPLQYASIFDGVKRG